MFQRNKKQCLVKGHLEKMCLSVLPIVFFFSFFLLRLAIYSSCRSAMHRITGGEDERGRSAVEVGQLKFETLKKIRKEAVQKTSDGLEKFSSMTFNVNSTTLIHLLNSWPSHPRKHNLKNPCQRLCACVCVCVLSS